MTTHFPQLPLRSAPPVPVVPEATPARDTTAEFPQDSMMQGAAAVLNALEAEEPTEAVCYESLLRHCNTLEMRASRLQEHVTSLTRELAEYKARDRALKGGGC